MRVPSEPLRFPKAAGRVLLADAQNKRRDSPGAQDPVHSSVLDAET